VPQSIFSPVYSSTIGISILYYVPQYMFSPCMIVHTPSVCHSKCLLSNYSAFCFIWLPVQTIYSAYSLYILPYILLLPVQVQVPGPGELQHVPSSYHSTCSPYIPQYLPDILTIRHGKYCLYILQCMPSLNAAENTSFLHHSQYLPCMLQFVFPLSTAGHTQ
jgi:hypothetical protein